jgi:hypothetical protein
VSTYLDEVISSKKFTGNVVIQIGANYFAIRQPDFGLVIASPKDKMVASLSLNPTQIDIRKVTTTIASFSFRLIDKSGFVSTLILGDAAGLIGQDVRIFLGRSNVDMAFSDYYELPVTRVNKIEHGENAYVFSTTEQTERMAKPIYSEKSRLDGDILAATTSWTMREDISDFPASGFLKCDDEIVSYSALDLVNNRFTGIIRGELNSVPLDHSELADVVLLETITDNPLNIIMKILISNGGLGVYDTLQRGLGISNALVDIAEIEALRDELFLDVEYTLSLFDIDSALRFIEDELLAPCGLRFTNSRNSKITLAILDKARFVEEEDVINEDTITKYPKWSIDGTKVTNRITINWDYVQGTDTYNERTKFENPDSITNYGLTELEFSFKGIKSALDGARLVEDLGSRLLARLSVPTPEIQINTQLDKSLQNIGDKSYLISSKIPAADGTLDFSSDLEIISRSINHTTGDVLFKLAFTSFTNIRSGYISPSDLITTHASQHRVAIAAGRGSYYQVGWYMLLWDETNNVYMSDPPNKIVDVIEAYAGLVTEGGDQLVTEGGENILLEETETEDEIEFEDDWLTDLSSGNYRIRFANYDDVALTQKRYGFISDDGNNFDSDNKPTYKVTY